VSEVIPAITGPTRRETSVHAPMESFPYRVPHHLSAVPPGGRTDFPELPGPYNGIPWASPI